MSKVGKSTSENKSLGQTANKFIYFLAASQLLCNSRVVPQSLLDFVQSKSGANQATGAPLS